MINKIAIVGRGNVATHLFNALKEKTEVILINPHTLECLPKDADLILVCVSDNAIKEVAEKIDSPDAIIAHTSGSIPMEILKDKNKKIGVFYPLQTFTKENLLNYEEIPVFIEGSSTEVETQLKNLASLFSKDVRKADSISRKKLHLASVFACNFTNAMAFMAKELLSESEISFSSLLPLMKQTVEKLSVLTPQEAQTGPAVRGDFKVIDEHLRMLEDKPDLQDIYSKMTKYIQNHKRDEI